MLRSFLALALLVPGTVNAATVEDAGYGFVYRVGVGGVEPALEQLNEDVISTSSSVSSPDGLGGTNVASVSGSLSTGEMRLTTLNPRLDGEAVASIEMLETLYFDLRSFSSTESFDVGFQVSVDGSLAQNAQPNMFFVAQSNNGLFSDALVADVGYRGVGDQIVDIENSEFRVFRDIGEWTSFGPSFFDGSLTLYGGAITSVNLAFGLSGTTTSLFGNTASIGVLTDLEYTSASGVFLSAVDPEPNTIPLPATGWLLLCAIGGFGWIRRSYVAS